MNRRGFLKAMVAPAIILTPGLLMPVRSFGSALSFLQSGTGFTQLSYAAILHGDGFMDDTAGLQAFLDGMPVLYNGKVIQDVLRHGSFLVKSQLEVRRKGPQINNCHFIGKLPQGDSMFNIHEGVFGGSEGCIYNTSAVFPVDRTNQTKEK